MAYQIPSWLTENGIRQWDSDVVARIVITAGPVVEDGDAGWYGSLTVPPFEDHLWACEHCHDLPEEAYDCALTELQSQEGNFR